MGSDRIPKQGQIYNHIKDKPYQIITVATHTETGDIMVVYQALYGEFKTYAKPLELFLSEAEADTIPENIKTDQPKVQPDIEMASENGADEKFEEGVKSCEAEGSVNALLMEFLDAASYNKKLEILTSNRKKLDNRIINDMAVSLDCAVEDGPIEQRINELIFCLNAMCRFEDRRLR